MPVDRYPLALGLEIAAVATAIGAVLGVGFAWLLENRQFPGKRTLGTLATAAIALPAPLLCYYLLAVLGRFWPLTRIGLAAAGVISTLPLLLRAARTSFASLNPAYAKAACSLGASEWRIFACIELPLAFRPILNGALLAFLRVLAELAAALWLLDAHV